MPTIPTLQGGVPLQAAPNVQRQSLRNTAGQSIAQGLVNVGDAVQKVRDQERLNADRAAFMDADRATDTVANDLLSQSQSVVGKDAIGMAPKMLEDFDKQSAEIGNGLRSPRQKLAYTEAVNNRRSQLQRQLDGHERQQTDAYYAKSREDYKDQAHVNAVTSYTDPQAIEGEIAKIASTLNQTPGLDADMRASELGIRRSAVYAGVIDRYLANDQVEQAESYYKAVKGNVNGDRATSIEAKIGAAKDRLKAQSEAGLSMARAELQDEVRNIEAQFKYRIPVTDVPSQARFVALYGERGVKMHEQVSKVAAASVDAARLDQLPSSEVAKLAESYSPTAKTKDVATQGELAGVIQNQANAVLHARATDSVGYLQKYSPTVSAASLAFSEDPNDQTRGAYLNSLRGERQRLQIPGDDILSKNDAAAVVDRMTRFNDTQKLTNSIRGEAARWGRDWPQVFAQVGKDLPDTAFFIGTGLSDKASGVVGATVGMTDDELKKRLPAGTTMKNVTEDTAEGLDDFAKSFPLDGTQALSKVLAGTEKLVVGYMGQGMSYSDAKAAAFAETNSKYKFLTFRNQTYRVPVDARVDAGIIDDGATALLRNLTVPEGLKPEGNATVAQLTDLYKRKGYWVTNEDETGLVLFYQGYPVGRGADGRGLFNYTWDQLSQAGVTDAAGGFEVPYAMRGPLE